MLGSALNNTAVLVGRVLLAIIFLRSGWGKIVGYEGTANFMVKNGVPGELLPLVILVELLGGILILIGWQTRWAAVTLAGFTILAAIFFHNNFADGNQLNHLLKNLAIAGGFLALFAGGPGAWSLDGRRSA